MVAWLGWMWLACAGSPASVATALETPAVQWVEHRYGAGPEHRVDWITREGAGPRPVVLFVHGGSWVGGDKDHLRQASQLTEWFLDRGYGVAAPEFRHASPPPNPSVGLEAMMADVAASVGWLHENQERLGLTTEGMVLVGFSSGAHLVSLLSSDPSWLAAEGLSPDAIDAVVCLDVHAYDVPLAMERMRGSSIEKNLRLIRHLFGDEARQRRLSPSTYVTDARIPPTLLVSAGASDRPEQPGALARETSAQHRDRLVAKGHTATHLHLDEASHVSLVMGFGHPGHRPTEAVEALLASARRTEPPTEP